MSERDELLRSILGTRHMHALHLQVPADIVEHVGNGIADAILDAGYSKPRTITTAKELDALTDRSIASSATTETYAAVKRMDGNNWWLKAGSDAPHSSGQITLPATVIYEPPATGTPDVAPAA